MRSWFLPLAFVVLFLVLIVRYIREPYRPLVTKAKPAPAGIATPGPPAGRSPGSGPGAAANRNAAPDPIAETPARTIADTPSGTPGESPPGAGSAASEGPFSVLLFVGTEVDDGRNIAFENAVDEAARYHRGRMTVERPDPGEAGSWGVSELPAVVVLGPDGAVRETFEGAGTAVMRKLKWRLMHP
jgi:hypothetical protein